MVLYLSVNPLFSSGVQLSSAFALRLRGFGGLCLEVPYSICRNVYGDRHRERQMQRLAHSSPVPMPPKSCCQWPIFYVHFPHSETAQLFFVLKGNDCVVLCKFRRCKVPTPGGENYFTPKITKVFSLLDLSEQSFNGKYSWIHLPSPTSLPTPLPPLHSTF